MFAHHLQTSIEQKIHKEKNIINKIITFSA